MHYKWQALEYETWTKTVECNNALKHITNTRSWQLVGQNGTACTHIAGKSGSIVNCNVAGVWEHNHLILRLWTTPVWIKTCTSFGAEKGRQQPSVLHRLRKRLAHACFSEFLGSYLRQFPRCFTLHLQQFVPHSRPFSGRLCWCQMELSSPVLHTLLTKQSHVILRHRRYVVDVIIAAYDLDKS